MVYIFALSRLNFVCAVFRPLLFKAFVGSLFLCSVLALLTQGGFNARLSKFKCSIIDSTVSLCFVKDLSSFGGPTGGKVHGKPVEIDSLIVQTIKDGKS